MIGFAQNVNIPDANFKAYLVGEPTINTNGDTEIQVSEATAFNGTIICSSMNITDLTGIEDFTALTQLFCYSNQLSNLDVSQNTALISLSCWSNQITSLDVSNNTALTSFNCFDNQLTSLDVSNNTDLNYLYCNNNQLTSLDVSQNTALNSLWCFDNQLTSLDLSQNTDLVWLECYANQFTSLDVRNGNNTNMLGFYAQSNPNLYCIDVDDVTWSIANWTVAIGNIDSTMSFSSNCATAFGCTDALACNYDSIATINDSSCIYSSSSYDTLSVTASIVWNGLSLNVSGDYSVTQINSVGCDSIANLNLTVTTTGIFDIANNKSNLIKITDILGQETPYRKNTPLFYIYDDGTVERKLIIE